MLTQFAPRDLKILVTFHMRGDVGFWIWLITTTNSCTRKRSREIFLNLVGPGGFFAWSVSRTCISRGWRESKHGTKPIEFHPKFWSLFWNLMLTQFAPWNLKMLIGSYMRRNVELQILMDFVNVVHEDSPIEFYFEFVCLYWNQMLTQFAPWDLKMLIDSHMRSDVESWVLVVFNAFCARKFAHWILLCICEFVLKPNVGTNCNKTI